MIYLFWFSIIFIFYAYFGYPLLLLLFTVINKRRYPEQTGRVDNFYPKVTLLISAYNEERVIEDKILNSLELDYPKELLEIVVISDGSNDMTNKIAERYADKGVILRYFEGRIGKTACLNKAVPLAKGDIVIFSDANSKYDREAVKELVKHFADKKIGFVTGTTKYVSDEANKALDSIGIYSKIEQITKRLESEIGSCVGADGAIFAIQKNLYQQLKDIDINDLVIPLNIVKHGYRGILEEKAFCIEKTAKNASGEFYRQVRITNRTIRAIVNNIELFNPLEFGIFSFQLLSHKVCKLSVPFFLLILLLTNVLLIKNRPLYLLLFSGQLLFYSSALLGYVGKYFKGLSRLTSVSNTFTIANLAVLLGWIKFIKGETYTTWNASR